MQRQVRHKRAGIVIYGNQAGERVLAHDLLRDFGIVGLELGGKVHRNGRLARCESMVPDGLVSLD
jgi:hypothetical protein